MTTNLTSTLRYAVIAILACFSTGKASAEIVQLTSAEFSNSKVYFIQNADTAAYLAMQYEYEETNTVNATPLVSFEDAYVFTITQSDGRFKIFDGDCYVSASTSTTAAYANFNTAYSKTPYYWDIEYVDGKGFTIKSDKGYLMYDGKGNAYAYTDGTEGRAIYWNIYTETEFVIETHTEMSEETGGFDFAGLSESVDVQLTKTLEVSVKNPVCLPMRITAEQVEEAFGEGTLVYEMDRIVNGYIYYQVRRDMIAGVPYIIIPSTTSATNTYEIKNITKTDVQYEPVSVNIGDYILKGSYYPETESDFYMYKDGALNHFSSEYGVKAFSCYITPVNPTTTETKLAEAIEFDEEVDGISSVSFQYSDNTPIYNIKGQVVRQTSESFDGLTPGIYVVRGKKIVVK